jgi:dipeptidyl aminopeptidase/acylaminoacyl peptidase
MPSCKLLFALAAVLVAAPLCLAQAGPAKRPITFEDMMKMKRLGETAVSPDGKWLVYSVTTVDLDQNTKRAELWVKAIAADSGSGSEPFKLAVAQAGDSGVDFSKDGKRILFLSGREGGQQVWVADFYGATGATGDAKRLTSLSTEADNAKWAPDGKSIVFTSAVYPDCPAISPADWGPAGSAGQKCNADRDAALAASKVKAQIFTHLLYRHWDHFTGDKRSHLFLASVDTGALRDLTPNDPHDVPPFSLGGDGGFSISPDSKELAFTENPDPEPATSVSAQIYTLDLTDVAAKPVKVPTSAGGNFNPSYSPDGKYLAWRSEARAGYESDKFRLLVYDRAAKTAKDLLPKFDNWVDEFAWASSSERIYFTSETHGASPIMIADLNGKMDTFFSLNTLGGLHPLPDDQTVLCTWSGAGRPGEIISLSTQPNSVREQKRADNTSRELDSRAPTTNLLFKQITNVNGQLISKLDMAHITDFWFKASDGADVQGFIIPPPGFDAKSKYPTKLLIHGGPQGAWGDMWSYRWNPELFAANGYVVVMINPRGSTGYGQAFVDGVNGDWGGKPFTDLMTGLDYAEEHFPFIDKTRECALGASYGGFMANWILGHTNRFKCIVSHDGVFDAESAFGTTEEDWFNIWEFKFPNTQGGHPWDYYGKPDAENPFRKWSPSLSAKNFKTPTLVIHSQHDYRLDVSEGFQLFDTLQLLHVPSKMLYFPDESHFVQKPQNSELWYKTVNDWVDEWTKKDRD